jgi:uncharacterized protein YlxP (DUF503 family)
MPIGFLMLTIYIPGCFSLKEKRSHIKPVLARLHREFNISVAEYGRLDNWQEAEIACALVSNDGIYIHMLMQQVSSFVETNWPDMSLINTNLEVIH